MKKINILVLIVFISVGCKTIKMNQEQQLFAPIGQKYTYKLRHSKDIVHGIELTINTLEVLQSDVYLPKINCENGGQIGFNVYDSEGKIIASQPLIVKEYYHPKMFFGSAKYIFRPQVVLNELNLPSGFYKVLPNLGKNFPLYPNSISFYYDLENDYISICKDSIQLDSTPKFIFEVISYPPNFNNISELCILNNMQYLKRYKRIQNTTYRFIVMI